MVVSSSLGELMVDQIMQHYQIVPHKNYRAVIYIYMIRGITFFRQGLSDECVKRETLGHRHRHIIYRYSNIYTYIYIYMYVCVCIYMYVCVCVCMCENPIQHKNKRKYIYIYVCMCVCVCVVVVAEVMSEDYIR